MAADKLIMLYGLPVSGKSTAAEKIRAFLEKNGVPARILSSAKLRLLGKPHGSSAAFVDERDKRTKAAKDKAYQKMLVNAEKCIRLGIVPVLDATHHLYSRRLKVYETAAKSSAQVYVVWTLPADKSEIMKRLRRREKESSLTKLHTWQQYETMAGQAERLEDYELSGGQAMKIRVIRLDAKSGKVALDNCGREDVFASLICKAIFPFSIL